jgi:1,4-alpha-glucan branching enzyme
MGSEFGQFDEWKDLEQLDWQLTEQFEMHRKIKDYVVRLNHLYKKEPALWELDFDPAGFAWIDVNNAEQGIISFIRKSDDPEQFIVFICNFTPQVHDNYRIGIPYSTQMYELVNSDSETFGGSGRINEGYYQSEPIPFHSQPFSIQITIPPLAAVMLKQKSNI